MATRAEALEHLKQLKQQNPAMTRREALEALKVFKGQVEAVKQEPVSGGLQDIPFTTQNLEAQEAGREQIRAIPEERIAEALGKGVQAGFEELGRQDPITLEQTQKTAARKAEFEEREARRGRGELTTGEKIQDIAFTEDVTRDPSMIDGGPVELAKAVGGVSSIFARGLGALVGKGDISKESTKLFKGSIEDLNEWAKSRKARNTSADQMISNLRNALSKESIPDNMRKDIEAQISTIEDGKNSGIITTAVDVLGNLFLETGSDPGVILGIGKGAVKQATKKPLAKTVEKGVEKTAQRLDKLGIRNNKMLEFLDAQPGANVREKLVNIRKRQIGDITPTGQIQEESLEALFDKRTLESLERNADAVQAELNALKSTEKDVLAGVAAKKEARKEAVVGEEKAGLLQEEIAGIEKKASLEASTKRAIEDIAPDISPDEIVGEFTNKGKFSGRGRNVGFEAAEKIEKATLVSKKDQINLIEETLVASEGGMTKGVDFKSKASRIWGKIPKDASSSDVAKVLKAEKADTKTVDTIKRIVRGDIRELRVAKEELDQVLAKGGDITGTAKESADNVKGVIDVVIEKSAGLNLNKLRTAQTLGGEIRDARNSLLSAMGVAPGESGIVGETIMKRDASSKFDEFIEKAAKEYAGNKFKPTPDMKQGGRFMEWKKHFGVDVRKEVMNRARKIGLTEETKGAVKAIDVDTKKAQKAITEASTSTKDKINKYAKQSTAQIKKGIRRRSVEIQKALDVAKQESALKRNVAKDFRNEVKHFAGDGGYSKNTESFKSFERKYGSKIADMVEDQAIFATFDVGPTGKIKNAEALLDSFKGVTAPTQGIQVAKFAEGAINKLSKKIKPFEGRVNKVINKTKSLNRELAKEINKAKKAGKSVDEQIELLMDKQPLITADVLASEFKFFEPLDFFDKKFLNGVARSTTGEYTNRQKMASKRLLNKLDRRGK